MGQKYNGTSLNKLLLLVSRKNIYTFLGESSYRPSIDIFRSVVQEVQIPIGPILHAFTDTFDIVQDKRDKSYTALYNYLKSNIKEMTSSLKTFMTANLPGSKGRYGAADVRKNLAKFDSLFTKDKGSPQVYFATMKQMIFSLSKVFPNTILNKGACGRMTTTPRHWKISRFDKSRITDIVTDFYKELKMMYDAPEAANVLRAIPERLQEILSLSEATPYVADITYKGTAVASIFDQATVSLLYDFYLLSSLHGYIELTEENTMLVRTSALSEEEEDDKEKEKEVDESFTGRAVLDGYKKGLRHGVAKLLYGFVNMLALKKNTSDKSYTEVMSRIYGAKQLEKDKFTQRLRDMTIEERRVDTVFKNYKIGLYNRGLQKSLVTYTGALDVEGGEAYDAARANDEFADFEEDILEKAQEDEEEVEEEEEDDGDGNGKDSDEEDGIGNFMGDDADGDPYGDEASDNEGENY